MKVLQVLDYYRPYGGGGAEWSVLELSRGLREYGIECTTIAPGWGEPSEESAYGIFSSFAVPVRPKPNSVLSPIWLSNPFFWVWSGLWILLKIIAERPDIVHVHGKYMIPGSVIAGAVTRAKIVVTLRDYIPLCPWGVCLFGGGSTHKGIVDFLSDELPQYMRLYGLQGSWRKVVVLLGGLWGFVYAAILRGCLSRATQAIYLSDLQAGFYRKSGYPKGVIIGNRCTVDRSKIYRVTNTVLYAGRLSYGKGVDRLLAAWKAIVEKKPGWQLVLCGDGPLRELAELYRRQQNRIIIQGYNSHEELLRMYKKVAFTVVPSVWPEPFGRVVMESVLSGTPVLATTHTGTAGFVRSCRVGWIVEPDVDALSRGLFLATANAASIRRRIGAQRSQLATQWDTAVVEEHMRIYRSFL